MHERLIDNTSIKEQVSLSVGRPIRGEGGGGLIGREIRYLISSF